MKKTSHHKQTSKEILRIDYFYKLYQKEKLRYEPQLFDVKSVTNKKRNKKVDFKMFKTIVSTYLQVYFNELYYRFVPLYFPLGGKMMLTCLSERGVSLNKSRIGWLWYLRPGMKFNAMCELKKANGTGTRVNKLDKQWSKQFVYDKLPIFIETYSKLWKQKSLFRQWKVD